MEKFQSLQVIAGIKAASIPDQARFQYPLPYLWFRSGGGSAPTGRFEKQDGMQDRLGQAPTPASSY